MHFVAALDSEPRMRAVLALFEGVATGAADGYARMADKPAATLLHLGCGLGNGLANLHNARKGQGAGGQHRRATTPPRIPVRRAVAVRHRNRGQRLARLCAHQRQHRGAVPGRGGRRHRRARPAGPGGHADPPADVSWGEGAQPCPPAHPSAAPVPTTPACRPSPSCCDPARRPPCCWAARRCANRPVGGRAHRRAGRRAAAGRGLPTRLTRGAIAGGGTHRLPGRNGRRAAGRPGSPGPGRCQGARVLFAYPGKRAIWCRTAAACTPWPAPEQDALASLEKLCAALARSRPSHGCRRRCAPAAHGRLTGAQGLQGRGPPAARGRHPHRRGHHQRPDAGAMTAGCPRHDLITLTGGAIGQGLPTPWVRPLPARIAR